MKKSRKVLSVVFVLCLVFSFVSTALPAYAIDDSIHSHDAVMRRSTCSRCGWMLGEVCFVSHSVFSNYSTHSFSGGTCTVSWYTGRMFYWCDLCNAADGYIDGHTCYGVHRGCGAGTDLVRFQVKVCLSSGGAL